VPKFAVGDKIRNCHNLYGHVTAVNAKTRLYSVAYVDGRSDENLEESALLLPGIGYYGALKLILFDAMIAVTRLPKGKKKKKWSQIIVPPWKDGGAINKDNVQDGPRERKKVIVMK